MTNDCLNREFAGTRYVAYSPTYWAPYRRATDEGIRADLDVLRHTWDGLITYGSKDGLENIPTVAHDLGFRRVILGVYDVKNDLEMENAARLVERYPEMIRSVCLGNEGLAFKLYSLAELTEAMRKLKARFPTLWITTSEPVFAFGEKALLDAVDYCFPIIHPWIHEIFKHDPTTAALWVIQTAQRLQLLSEKVVLIKETGFPGDGDRYPYDLQATYWEVLLRELGAFTRNVHLAVFEAFDIPDKIHFSAMTHWDCYWGIYDRDRNPKPVAEVIERHLGERARRNTAVTVAARQGVSVVVATKDRPHYLKCAVESVLSHGKEVTRLILVNDDSRDPEVEPLCLSYSASPRVKYVRLRGKGSSGTSRNAGLAHVDTDYVCFLDDDDEFLPGKVESQLAVLRERPDVSFVATGATVIDSDGELCGRSGNPDFFPGAPLVSMLAFCRVIHSSVMMRTKTIRDSGGYLEHFKGEDWELWCRFLRDGETMEYLDTPLTLYRRHASNISTPLYLREAVDNVLSRHLDLSSEKLISPLPYAPPSEELVKATVLMLHGLYARALGLLEGLDLPAARIARFLCHRELGEYGGARREIGAWSESRGLGSQLDRRLWIHASRFNAERRSSVGSPALLFEQRLLAHDVLETAVAGETYRPDLGRYFHQSPKHINIEYENDCPGDEVFFRRVSLTSC